MSGSSDDGGELLLRDVVALAMTEGPSEDGKPRTIRVIHPADDPTPDAVIVTDEDPKYLIHETTLLRTPLYRTQSDPADDRQGSYFDEPNSAELPLVHYEYDAESALLSRIGELNTRDMLVMASIQQAFYNAGSPVDGKVYGDQATLGHIARSVGLHPEGATRLIRTSIERLATSKVRLRLMDEHRRSLYPVDAEGEVVFGFIAGYGWRKESKRGVKTNRSNYIQLDPTLADLIRRGNFTFLRADVLRALRHSPLALKLYAWARTHRPNDRGTLLPHGVSTLARKLGCSDTNTTRRRRKMEEALELVCKVATDEFPGYSIKPGRRDHIVVLKSNVRPRPRIASPSVAS